MRVVVAIICCKGIESKLAGESTLSPRVSWLSDSFYNAKEDAIDTIKTIGRPRDPRDEVGGDCVIEESCLIFLEYSKEIFKATWLTCKTNKTTL